MEEELILLGIGMGSIRLSRRIGRYGRRFTGGWGLRSTAVGSSGRIIGI